MGNEVKIKMSIAGTNDVLAGVKQVETAFQRQQALLANSTAALSSVSSLTGGFGSQALAAASDLSALTANIGNLFSALSKLKNIGSVLSGTGAILAAVLGTGVAGYGAVKAALQESAAKEELIAVNERLAKSLSTVVTEEYKAGNLHYDVVKKYVDTLALLKGAQSGTEGSDTEERIPGILGKSFVSGPMETSDTLLRLAKEIRQSIRTQLPEDAFVARRAAMLAAAQAEADITKAKLAQEEAMNNLTYERGTVTLEGYLKKREELIEGNRAAENNLINQQIPLLKIAADEADPKNKAAILQQIEDLNQKRKLLNMQAQTDETKLLQEGEEQRKQIRSDYEQQEREQLAAFNAYKIQQAEKMVRELELDRDIFDVERARAANNFRLDDGQKREALLKSLRDERDLINSQVASLKAKRDAETDLATKNFYDQQATALQHRGKSVDTSIAGTEAGADPNSISDQLALARNQFGTTAQIIGRAFTSVIGTAVSSVADGIGGLIKGTKTWGAALSEIGLGIVNGIIDAFARMVSEWIVSHVIMEGIAWAFTQAMIAIKWLATGEEIAAEETKTGVLGINAVLNAIASDGVGAAIGIAAFVAALGVGIAAATGAFKEGGYTGSMGVNDVAGVVHGQEFVMPADATKRIGVSNLEAMKNGAATDSMIDSGGRGVGAKVIIVDSRQKARDLQQTSEWRDAVIQTVAESRHRHA